MSGGISNAGSGTGKSSAGAMPAPALTNEQKAQIGAQSDFFNSMLTPGAGVTPQPVPGSVAPTGMPQADPVTQPGQTFNPAPGPGNQPGAFDYGPIVGQMQQYVQSMQKLFESLPR